MTLQLRNDVERHERSLYGGNGEGIGLLGRMRMVEDYIGELRVERKEAAADRRKIFVGVLTAGLVALLGAVINIVTLLLTHPDLIRSASSP